MKLFKDKIKKNYHVIYIMLSIIFLTGYKSFDYEFLKEKKQPDNIKHSKNNPKVQKSFQNLIKGCIKKEGLFDYYWDQNENKCFLVINPNQLGQVFLLALTRQTGDAYRYHGSAMMYDFPFSFKRVGNNIKKNGKPYVYEPT